VCFSVSLSFSLFVVSQAKTHRDQEQAALEEKKKHQDLLNRIKKRQRYASLVKEMYHPMPSASKRAQVQQQQHINGLYVCL